MQQNMLHFNISMQRDLREKNIIFEVNINKLLSGIIIFQLLIAK